jgi:23S rRNA pseudouridine1911/1915/1917 synthase
MLRPAKIFSEQRMPWPMEWRQEQAAGAHGRRQRRLATKALVAAPAAMGARAAMVAAVDDLVRRVTPERAGLRLDSFLALQAEVGSRRRAKEMVEAGAVRVDGEAGKPGMIVEAGQEVAFTPLAVEAPPTAAELAAGAPPLRILYEDPFLLVIDKPPGLAAHPPPGAKGYRLPTVAALALAHCGDLPLGAGEDRPGIVHRLDKDTSGVMLVAKTGEALDFLRAQFKARTVAKEYLCTAFGMARFDSDWIEAPIASLAHIDRMVIDREAGREASTYYEVAERFRGFTFFRCLPKTGRTHQIRLHMSSIGHPLVGDKLYRSRTQQHLQVPAAAPQPVRQHLHAHRIEVLHPYSREPLDFSAALPADMEELLSWLRRERSV